MSIKQSLQELRFIINLTVFAQWGYIKMEIKIAVVIFCLIFPILIKFCL
jgi:hypothetical protein